MSFVARCPNSNSRGHTTKRGEEKEERKKERSVFAPERIRHCTQAGVLLRMQDLHCGTNDICIAARLADLRWKTHNPRYVAWPLELGLGTHNPHYVAWPLELGLGTCGPLHWDPLVL